VESFRGVAPAVADPARSQSPHRSRMRPPPSFNTRRLGISSPGFEAPERGGKIPGERGGRGRDDGRVADALLCTAGHH